jgi:uncharacterized protein YcnI
MTQSNILIQEPKTMMRSILLAAGLLAAAGAAQAHVSVTPTQAKAGGYQLFRFGLGHACDGSKATTALRLEIPAGVTSAKPQAKPGWKMTVEPGEPGGAPKAIVWRGNLSGEEFDEFLVFMKLPAKAGAMPIVATQTCDKGETRWADPAGSKTPAPLVTLTAGGADPMAGMAGMGGMGDMPGMNHDKH